MGIRHILAYGSLMSSFWNHERYCRDALTIEPAVTTGRLYHLPQGYPAMFDAPDGQVFGEIMTFPDIDRTLKRLDRLEGYRPDDNRSHYIRIEKSVTILNNGNKVSAWVYVYQKERLRPDFIMIPTGCWREFGLSSNLCSF